VIKDFKVLRHFFCGIPGQGARRGTFVYLLSFLLIFRSFPPPTFTSAKKDFSRNFHHSRVLLKQWSRSITPGTNVIKLFFHCLSCQVRIGQSVALLTNQGILKGDVSLYGWPPVWLVWNQLYDNWQFLFLFAKQANPNRSNRRSMVQWYFPH